MFTCSSPTVALSWCVSSGVLTHSRFGPDTVNPCSQRGRFLNADKKCVLANACPVGTFADANSAHSCSLSCPYAPSTRLTGPNSTENACTKCYHVLAKTCKDATQFGATSWCAHPRLFSFVSLFSRTDAFPVHSVNGGCFSVNTCLYANRLVGGYYCPGAVPGALLVSRLSFADFRREQATS